MSKFLKLVLTILVTIVVNKSCASTVTRDEPESNDPEVPGDTATLVVDEIRDTLEDLKDGATSAGLKYHVSVITFLVNEILAEADVDVDASEAQEVIESVLAAVYGDDKDDDVKTDAKELDRAFNLLDGIAEALSGILETPERDGLYATLFAVNIATTTVLDTVNDIENSLVFYYEPDVVDEGDDDVVDEGDDDGGNAVSDNITAVAAAVKRSRGISKRRTCIGIGWNSNRNCFGLSWGKKRNQVSVSEQDSQQDRE